MSDIEADTDWNRIITLQKFDITNQTLSVVLFVVILGSPTMTKILVDSIELDYFIHPDEYDQSTLSSSTG